MEARAITLSHPSSLTRLYYQRVIEHFHLLLSNFCKVLNTFINFAHRMECNKETVDMETSCGIKSCHPKFIRTFEGPKTFCFFLCVIMFCQSKYCTFSFLHQMCYIYATIYILYARHKHKQIWRVPVHKIAHERQQRRPFGLS